MCGIVGVATQEGSRPPEHELLRNMCAQISHRGPDDEGFLEQPGVGLGIRRLQIIDIAGGHQPIHNEDASVWTVFNGEIYNFRALRLELEHSGHTFGTRADTEVIVHAYEEWGDAFVERLNGMFAIAIWDSGRRRLILARDRTGIKPLYYAATPGRLHFGSEVKALLVDQAIPRELDMEAVDDYLALEYIPSPRTIFRAIRKLPPAHLLTWDWRTGRVTVKRYWDVPLGATTFTGDVAGEATRLLEHLREAVRQEMVADVPVGVFLSGGIDSSAIAAMATAVGQDRINTFSIGFADESFDESRWAARVAEHLGTVHHHRVLEPGTLMEIIPELSRSLDEPFADASIIPTYLLSKFARGTVTVALGGDGGDELFAGYPTLQAHRVAEIYEKLPGALRSRIRPVVDRLPVSLDNISFDFKAKRFVRGVGLSTAERHLAWVGAFLPEQRRSLLTEAVRRDHGSVAIEEALNNDAAIRALASPLDQVLAIDMRTYLEGDILTKLDRASMLASLEARVPFLNVGMVEYAASLPVSLKLRGMTSKYLLKRALAGVLPADIISRPKKGFGVPVAKWIRGPLKELVHDTLSKDSLQRDGMFDASTVQRLMADHQSGAADNRKQLWTLFMFQQWMAVYGRPLPSSTAAAAG
ncbi:MAG: hypothetical protein QOK05_2498 [Chloroflexota bacterium]|jgi:asparagine synthase (glutamine-hydrolysing)|nr:hypothetical protein [Chloroflexota bacterium]